MKAIIRVEGRRILTIGITIMFFMILLLFSISSSYQAVRRYEVWDETGLAVSGLKNLEQSRKNLLGKDIEESLVTLKQADNPIAYIDETNMELLVSMNYGGKTIQELSKKEIESFYSKRLSNVQEMLDYSSRITYTEKEKNKLMERAGQLSELSMDFAEGWKVINREMGTFILIMLVLISIIIVPLFGTDSQTKMKELYRSTRYGKRHLDYARIVIAFGVGIILYSLGIILYFIIKMLPFGLTGWNEYIQSNADTFFSPYYITYLRQFLLNILFGFVALIFTISLTILVAVLAEGIMTGAVVITFFWILLIVAEQMAQYSVNHWFANFMPLRTTAFMHYYVENELYRFWGNSISSMMWCPSITVLLSVLMLVLSMVCLLAKRRKTA